MKNTRANGLYLLELHGSYTKAPVKAFMCWVKMSQKNKLPRFACAQALTTLDPKLSLYENILWGTEEHGSSLPVDRPTIKKFFETHGLSAITGYLNFPNHSIQEATEQEKILAATAKALVSEAEDVFIELPDNLDPFLMRVLKKILVEKSQVMRISLVTNSVGFWLDDIDEIVTIKEQGITSVALKTAA